MTLFYHISRALYTVRYCPKLFFKPLQPLKQLFGISLIESGMLISLILQESKKQPEQSEVTLSGIITPVNLLHLLKAYKYVALIPGVILYTPSYALGHLVI